MPTDDPDIVQRIPGPLELSRMHEAELKHCYKQYGLLGALVSQIMVGRVITSMNSEKHRVTEIKLKDGKVLVYGLPHGRPHNRKRGVLVCEGLGSVTIVEGAKP